MKTLHAQPSYELDDVDSKWLNIHKLARDIEAQFDVASWQNQGLDLWPLLKTSFLLRAASFHVLKRTDRINKIRRLIPGSDYLAAVIKQVNTQSFPKAVEQTDILFCLNGGSFEAGPAGFEHKLAAPWQLAAQQSGYRTQTLLYDGVKPNGSVGEQAALSDLIVYPVVDWGAVKNPTRSDDITLGHDGLSNFFQQIATEFGLGILSKTQTTSMIWRVQQAKDFFIRYLTLAAPKVVFVQCYYGPVGWGLNAAASELGIKVYDLQHGVQGPSHEAYTFPSGRCAQANTLPHGYLTWNKASKEHLDSWVAEPEHVIEGVPFRLALDSMRAEENTALASPQKPKNDQRPRVVYLAYHKENLKQVMQFIKEQSDWVKIEVQLHPLDVKMDNSNSARRNLIENLKNADGAITAMSSSAIEAQGLGLPVLVYNSYGRFILSSALSPEKTVFGSLGKQELNTMLSLEKKSLDKERCILDFERAWCKFQSSSGLTRPA